MKEEFTGRFITAPICDSDGGTITDIYQERTRINARHVKQAWDLRFQNNSATLESLGIGLPNQQLEPFRMTVAPGIDNLNGPIAPPGEEFFHWKEWW